MLYEANQASVTGGGVGRGTRGRYPRGDWRRRRRWRRRRKGKGTEIEIKKREREKKGEIILVKMHESIRY